MRLPHLTIERKLENAALQNSTDIIMSACATANYKGLIKSAVCRAEQLHEVDTSSLGSHLCWVLFIRYYCLRHAIFLRVRNKNHFLQLCLNSKMSILLWLQQFSISAAIFGSHACTCRRQCDSGETLRCMSNSQNKFCERLGSRWISGTWGFRIFYTRTQLNTCTVLISCKMYTVEKMIRFVTSTILLEETFLDCAWR